MTSIKLKFRPPTTSGKEGSLIFQLIHKRSVQRITSKYKIFAEEWNEKTGRIMLPSKSSPRYAYLVSAKSDLKWELGRLKRMVQESKKTTGTVNLNEIAASLSPCPDTPDSVFNFIRKQIQRKKRLGKARSSETYRSTLKSFIFFRNGMDLTFDLIDAELMELYEAWMLKEGLTRNTTSFYMRVYCAPTTNWQSRKDLQQTAIRSGTFTAAWTRP